MSAFTGAIEPWHVFVTLLTAIAGLAIVLGKVLRSAGVFRKSILDELKVTRVSIKELLEDLTVRNPEAMGRIVAAMDDHSVIDFVRSADRRKR